MALPVQISANVILVLSKTFIVIREAETCPNLEKQTLFLKDLTILMHRKSQMS